MKKPSQAPADVDTAALYAVGGLTPDEQTAFESELADQPALRTEVDGFLALAEELALSVRPTAPRPEARARLLERVAAEKPAKKHMSLPPYFFAHQSELPWDEINPGVAIKMLTPGARTGHRAFLLRIAPGGTVAAHEHRFAEHCYVLSGEVDVLGEHLVPGDYHLADAGTSHRDFTSEQGCLLLIVDGAPA